MSEATPLLEAVRDLAGEALRDLWTFDRSGQECLYVRDDVADHLEDHDPEAFIDNERYGYITRLTYEELTYTGYEYTVRGFTQFETFRTFLDDGSDSPVGVLVSVDRGSGVQFADLFSELLDVPGYGEPDWDVPEVPDAGPLGYTAN
ncbi:hypothetical protein N0B31_09450 [Salinirubellus salinus]|uniref:Uncharacterized protein n=1 Tax=Salinirubellus salinus TaxID=1364945 RepID=A0A9E7R6S1_9EURY|nr:hypothetical protein [Salinirubellus salinus]UWM56501.1 hypothetical protein N0B31_09450 [Salinirubellus salinus]